MTAITVAWAVTMLAGLPAWAAVLTYSGDLEVISHPRSLARGALVSDVRASLIEENAFSVLSRDIAVDIISPGTYDHWSDLRLRRPTLPAGLAVSSYLVHADPAGSVAVFDGTITFTSAVLALIVHHRTLRSTNRVLGAADITYPAHGGLELSCQHDSVSLSDDRLTILWRLTAWRDIDEFRIVGIGEDPAPEPSTAALFCVGLVVLAITGSFRLVCWNGAAGGRK